MTEKERVALIRKGNELFNSGNFLKAEEIFVKTMYKDGLIRIGDYFYFEKKLPLYAYKYYKLADCKEKVSEIFDRMIFALNQFMGEDDGKKDEEYEPPKVHPKLKILAEEIIRESEKKNQD